MLVLETAHWCHSANTLHFFFNMINFMQSKYQLITETIINFLNVYLQFHFQL